MRSVLLTNATISYESCYTLFFSYKLRLEGMLQKEEFQMTVVAIEPNIEAIQGAIRGELLPFATKSHEKLPRSLIKSPYVLLFIHLYILSFV